MKSILLSTTLLLLSPGLLRAQAVAINTDGSLPALSAILDVKSTNKGVLVPRMTSAQRGLIAAPATGLLVFDTGTGSFWFYNGTTWTNLSASVPATFIADTDGNTRVQTEEMPNEDVIRFDLAGQERMVLRQNAGGTLRLDLFNTNFNMAIGKNAMYTNTIGEYNTAVGDSALYANTQGVNNTAVGYRALRANIYAYYNTAIGADALRANKFGDGNTAIGSEALSMNTEGAGNVAIGRSAMGANTVGDRNIAIGGGALRTNVEGSGNVAIGQSALETGGNSYGNVAIGQSALQNSSASGNTAIGSFAMSSSGTSGASNTAAGQYALRYNTTGHRNTALGESALSINTTGFGNTGLGFDAGDTSATNRYSTFVGYDADYAPGIIPDVYYSTALGYNARVEEDYQVKIGHTGILSIGGYQNWTNFSDGRYKKQVQADVKGLDFILRLRPVTYQLDISGLSRRLGESTPDGGAVSRSTPKDQIRQTGFIAQEVETAAQQAGYLFSGVDAPQNANGLYGLRYAEFTVPLVKAVQELDTTDKQQHQELEALKAENAALKAQLDTQAALLQKISAALQTAGIGVEN